MAKMTSWHALLSDSLSAHGEFWADVVATTLTEADLDQRFNTGYGAPKGIPFTVWTRSRVYFPACYDGAEWVASVARHPDGEPTDHVGGG